MSRHGFIGPEQDLSMQPLRGFPEGIFRNNFVEMFGVIHSAQCTIGNAKPRCGEMQMNAVECLEAYGAKRGRRVCKPFMDDFYECMNSYIQLQRVNEMTKERMRQLMRGERSPANYHDKVKPPRDALQFGPFHP